MSVFPYVSARYVTVVCSWDGGRRCRRFLSVSFGTAEASPRSFFPAAGFGVRAPCFDREQECEGGGVFPGSAWQRPGIQNSFGCVRFPWIFRWKIIELFPACNEVLSSHAAMQNFCSKAELFQGDFWCGLFSELMAVPFIAGLWQYELHSTLFLPYYGRWAFAISRVRSFFFLL